MSGDGIQQGRNVRMVFRFTQNEEDFFGRYNTFDREPSSEFRPA
jgi:hypothetical protein